MSTYPGIPTHEKLYEELSPRIVVTIFEQGQPPHPNSLDRLYLYVKVGGRFVQMGSKITIPKDFDLKRWAKDCLRNRISTREDAVDRLRLELKATEKELKALEAAKRDTYP